MNDVLCGKLITTRDFGLTRFATTKQSAFMYQIWSCGAMDCAIHATTTQEAPARLLANSNQRFLQMRAKNTSV